MTGFSLGDIISGSGKGNDLRIDKKNSHMMKDLSDVLYYIKLRIMKDTTRRADTGRCGTMMQV